MSRKTLSLDDRLSDYITRMASREPGPMARLREMTDALPEANMRSATDQVQFLMLMLRLMGARRVLEVGVFTGYATLGFALALPDDGWVTGLDVTDRWLDEGRRQWAAAGVAGRIDLRLGPADETLRSMRRDPEGEPFDLAYIDADKEGYIAYYEDCLALLRPGGLIAVDNVLWSGRVADPEVDDADTNAIRAFNAHVRDDNRVDLSLLPLGDGVTLARKRGAGQG